MILKEHLDTCKDLAVKAGKAILEIYNSDFKVDYKEDDSPLTKADSISDEIILEGLKKAFPDIPVLSEESQDNLIRLENEWCFIVDPLDGTKEFIKRNGEFTVNIALVHEGRSVTGVIYVPVKEELFFAQKGKGAFYKKDGTVKRIKVSDRTENIRLVMSRSHASDKLKAIIEKNNIKDIKRAGSSIKGCLVAMGEAEVYYRFGPTMEWDTAAMQCIVEEAGGIFRQMDDSEMTYNRKDSVNRKGFYVLNSLQNKLH